MLIKSKVHYAAVIKSASMISFKTINRTFWDAIQNRLSAVTAIKHATKAWNSHTASTV